MEVLDWSGMYFHFRILDLSRNLNGYTCIQISRRLLVMAKCHGVDGRGVICIPIFGSTIRLSGFISCEQILTESCITIMKTKLFISLTINSISDLQVSKVSWDHIPNTCTPTSLPTSIRRIEYCSVSVDTIEKAQAIKEGGNNFVQRGTTVAAEGIKAINPEAVLYYKNIIIDWHGSDATPALEAISNSYLKKTDGEFLTIGGRFRKYFDVSMRQFEMVDGRCHPDVE